MEILKKFLWQIISGILFVILVVSVLTNGFGLKQVLTGFSADKLAGKTVEFINQYLMQPGSVASLTNASCNKKVSLCKFTVNVNENSFDSYVSSDGQILFPDAIEIEKFKEQKEAAGAENSNQQASLENLPKKEKPEVGLFIMSYCPFGLQAQKVLLPVMDLLKDKADIKIHFVNYVMHDKKEIDENLRQYCLQKQEPEKYQPYLNCFLAAGEFEKCLTEAKINKTKLNSCVSQTDKDYKISAGYEDKATWLNGTYPHFDVETDLNQKYGVAGSPTMVINDQVVSPKRSSQDYKEAICLGFKSMPEECFEELSSQPLVSGFGFEQGLSAPAGDSSGGKCE